MYPAGPRHGTLAAAGALVDGHGHDPADSADADCSARLGGRVALDRATLAGVPLPRLASRLVGASLRADQPKRGASSRRLVRSSDGAARHARAALAASAGRPVTAAPPRARARKRSSPAGWLEHHWFCAVTLPHAAHRRLERSRRQSSSVDSSRSLITFRRCSASASASTGQLSGSTVKPRDDRGAHEIYVARSTRGSRYRSCVIRVAAGRIAARLWWCGHPRVRGVHNLVRQARGRDASHGKRYLSIASGRPQ